MKPIIIYLSLMLCVSQLTAQSPYGAILDDVEKNSSSLSALREQMEAQQLANRTGIFLTNPELEFNYLWASPSGVDDGVEYSLKQSFDFPSVYVYKGQVADLENANAELVYKSERINLLLRAKEIIINLTYYNALAKEYAVRLENAEMITKSYQKKYDSGEANVLEMNKVQLNLTEVRNEIARIHVERTSLLSELKVLNGGLDVSFDVNSFPKTLLPMDFEEWYAVTETKSPVLQYVKGQIEMNEKRVSLNRALTLPKFSAGYIRESAGKQHFQGLSIGVSIPLWENKNRIKQAKAEVEASQAVAEESRMQFYVNLQNLFDKASTLQKSVANYRSSFDNYNNAQLLKKALDGGEISLLNYLLEMQYYYQAIANQLVAERDLELSIAQLSAVEL